MLAAVAARRRGSTATKLGRAPAPAGAVSSRTAARGHRPSEVRSGTHMPHVPHVCMHHTTY
jgi:hypothetical protein